MSKQSGLIPISRIENRILLIRGERVIIDSDLAEFYGVPTKRLNEQVKRNLARFPEDFVFQLRPEEKQEVVANCDHLAKIKFSSTLPYAFTEHGAIMAANVINSDRAIEMGLFVVRAFVRLRTIMSTHQDLSQKLAQLERHLIAHDQQLAGIVAAVRSLLGKKEIPNKRRRAHAVLSPAGRAGPGLDRQPRVLEPKFPNTNGSPSCWALMADWEGGRN